MRQGLPFTLTLLFTILAVISTAPMAAQLTLEWQFNVDTLGVLWYIPPYQPYCGDDEGNTVVAYHSSSGGAGIGLALIDSAGNLIWKCEKVTDYELRFIVRSATGESYVVAIDKYYDTAGQYQSSLLAFKVDNYGNEVWSVTHRSPTGNTHYVGDCFTVDSDGNLWVASSEVTSEPACPDINGWDAWYSAFSLIRIGSSSGDVSQVVLYHPQGSSAWGTTLTADHDGHIYAYVTVQELCCDANCNRCYEDCFLDGTSMIEDSTYYRNLNYVRRYSTGGGLEAEEYLTSSETLYQYQLGGDRTGNPWIIRKYQYCTYDPVTWVTDCDIRSFLAPLAFRPGTEIVGYVGSSVVYNYVGSRVFFDYNGNAIFRITPWVDTSPGEGNLPLDDLVYVNGQTGAIDWIYTPGAIFAADQDGYLYLIDFTTGDLVKYTADLVETERMSTPAYAGGFLYSDASSNLYFRYAGYLKKYVTGKKMEIKDVNDDPMPDLEFTLSIQTFGAPAFNFNELGTFTTDSDGQVELEYDTDSTFAIQLSSGRHILSDTTRLRISKLVHTEPARRAAGGMFNLYLDNGKFAADGSMSYATIDVCATNGVVMDHTEIRYNLTISTEWRATEGYINSLDSGLANFSNYLYDITDGQVRLDTVTVYTGGNAALLADMFIKASNVEWAYCENGVGGIWQRTHETGVGASKRIVMPRKFYGDTAVTARTDSYSEGVGVSGVLDVNTPTDFRTKVHEFGHYAFGFYDEYLFWNPGILGLFAGYQRDDNGNLRCRPRSEMIYGFMDYQYAYGAGYSLEYASEMSSKYRYELTECRNTKQYREYGRSCWNHLELLFELMDWGPDSLRVPILKPDLDDEDERHDLTPNQTFIGPNDDLLSPNYDVGDRLILVNHALPTAPDYVNKSIRVAGVPGVDRCQVNLVNKPGDPGGGRTIYQGKTSDEGKIWVLGVYEPDHQINVTKNRQVGRWTTTASASGHGVNSSGEWSFGSISSVSGDSLVIDLQTVAGDYPLLITAGLNTGSTTIGLIAEHALPELPSLDLVTTDSGMFNYAFTSVAGGYTASVSSELGGEGQLIVNAVDAEQNEFFFYCPYTKVDLASDTAATIYSITAPSGMAEVLIDTVNSSLVKASMLTSSYPVPLTGVGEQAVQVGPAYSLALQPQVTLDSANQILIRYSEDDLLVEGGTLAGMESMLRIHLWDEVNSLWAPLTSAVDTVGNTVAATIDQGGVYGLFASQVVSDVDDDGYGQTLPYRFELRQNYPNPFNPATTIEYSLAERAHVTIEVYNVLGQKVRSLVDREESAGSFTISWDGKDASGKPVSTGVYLYRFQAGEHVETKKMLLLK